MEPIQYIQRIRSNKAGEKPVELAEIVAGIVVLLFCNHVFLFFFGVSWNHPWFFRFSFAWKVHRHFFRELQIKLQVISRWERGWTIWRQVDELQGIWSSQNPKEFGANRSCVISVLAFSELKSTWKCGKTSNAAMGFGQFAATTQATEGMEVTARDRVCRISCIRIHAIIVLIMCRCRNLMLVEPVGWCLIFLWIISVCFSLEVQTVLYRSGESLLGVWFFHTLSGNPPIVSREIDHFFGHENIIESWLPFLAWTSLPQPVFPLWQAALHQQRMGDAQSKLCPAGLGLSEKVLIICLLHR